MFKRLKRRIAQLLYDRWVFDRRVQERAGRQAFFYKAFRALQFNGIEGAYAEFGCHGGMTFGLAYQEARRNRFPVHLWAFDSFEGLPAQSDEKDEHPQWNQGSLATPVDDFHKLCRSKGIPRSAYSVVPGFYDVSLPALGDTGEPVAIAMAYIDCDLYTSTRSVLDFLMPRLTHGMIIAFDDYYCWSATQLAGERRAADETFADHPTWRLSPYLAFGWHGQSFVVERRDIS